MFSFNRTIHSHMLFQFDTFKKCQDQLSSRDRNAQVYSLYEFVGIMYCTLRAHRNTQQIEHGTHTQTHTQEINYKL